ncbi:hypothetical protein J6590_087646 [Homalodisca vitripennis]|nr:hypothetical protein J6590_087646 [Homalodisca vitripennis]
MSGRAVGEATFTLKKQLPMRGKATNYEIGIVAHALGHILYNSDYALPEDSPSDHFK